MGYLGEHKIDSDPLERVITWKSKVMGTKEVEAGTFVGYGNSYLARDPMTVALVPVGYADGFARSLSNHGRVLVNGHRATVVGKVSMNMLTADVTEVPETAKGDEVVLIGQQGDVTISVAPFGERDDLMNYERLTKLSTRIPRKVVD
jgi:alanine racemase